MPTPMRALTNDYKDCRLIKLDPDDPTSPYAVMQEGYYSADTTCRMRMFYLQRDGQWMGRNGSVCHWKFSSLMRDKTYLPARS